MISMGQLSWIVNIMNHGIISTSISMIIMMPGNWNLVTDQIWSRKTRIALEDGPKIMMIYLTKCLKKGDFSRATSINQRVDRLHRMFHLPNFWAMYFCQGLFGRIVPTPFSVSCVLSPRFYQSYISPDITRYQQLVKLWHPLTFEDPWPAFSPSFWVRKSPSHVQSHIPSSVVGHKNRERFMINLWFYRTNSVSSGCYYDIFNEYNFYIYRNIYL